MVNLHILGAQKCGTSALAHFLHQHPDIYVLDGKEAHVFDHPQFLKSTNKMAFAKRAFLKRMSRYNEEAYICDATPITLFSSTFLRHCYAYNPKAKFIVILREPFERAESHYKMSLSKGLEDKNMLAAFIAEGARLSAASNDWSMHSRLRTQSYLKRSLYSTQLSALFQIIPKEQVLVLYQDDLINQHQASLDAVFSFLRLKKVTIEKAFIFKSKVSKHSLYSQTIRLLAKLYCKMYFLLKRENRKRWEAIINDAKPSKHTRVC